MYGGPIGTHQRSFELYHPDPLRLPLCGHSQGLPQFVGIPPPINQEQAKLGTSNLAGTFIGCIRTKAH